MKTYCFLEIFTETDPDSFYISNDNIIIKSCNDITLLWQDINKKENKIRDLNLEVSELKLNDINNQITSIHTALNNITSSHKAENDCPKISSNHDINEIKFLREELKNILLENIFCNNKDISSYKKLEDNYQNNFEKNRFETPKRYSFKNSDKTQGIETVITRNI